MGGYTGSNSLGGLVIGVLSVSCLHARSRAAVEFLCTEEHIHSGSTTDDERTTASPLTHDQHTQCYWSTLDLHPAYALCSAHRETTIIVCV